MQTNPDTRGRDLKVDERFFHDCSRLIDQDMRVQKTLIQTLACQLSSTFMQLLFSFDQDMRVEKTLIQTLPS